VMTDDGIVMKEMTHPTGESVTLTF
jgi:hypothetical protein